MLITQTPLRVSLAGGGTDFAAYYEQGGGTVVSAAIDKYIYVILNSRFDEKIYLSYSKVEIVDTVDEIRHELVREAMRKAGVTRGVEIGFMADIPSEGCGLGSSSSFTVGLLNALYTYRGIQAPAERLAAEACEIEIDICGKPIGKQDQYIAAYGGLRRFHFRPDGAVDEETIGGEDPWKRDLERRLLLFYTNVTRKADPILKTQNQRTAVNREQLDQIRVLADRAFDSLSEGDYRDIGAILAKNWDLKRELSEGISNPNIDRMVSQAEGGGASGCKICGAGGGGFLLTYCPSSRLGKLRRAMAEYREMPFFFDRCGSRVIFNVEGYEWKSTGPRVNGIPPPPP